MIEEEMVYTLAFRGVAKIYGQNKADAMVRLMTLLEDELMAENIVIDSTE